MAKSSTPYTQSGAALQSQQDSKVRALTVVQKHQSFLTTRLDQLARWVVGGLRPEALIRFALLDLQTNPKLQECHPSQVYLGLLACAQAGLEPGALKQHAFLVPFRDNRKGVMVCQFMTGWRGMIVQARRSKEVLGVHADVVHEGDAFKLKLGTSPHVDHEPLLRGDRGPIIGAYAVAEMAHGSPEVEWMKIEDLEKIKRMATARGPSPAWKDWEDQQYRKTPIRRLSKRLPMNQDYYAGQAIEDAHEDGDFQKAIDIIDVMTDGEATRSTDQAGAAPKSYEEQEAEEAERALSAKENADGK